MTSSSERAQQLKKPLVSIVMPIFNDEELLARALDTAIKQSLKNIEIICVDDYSTDGSAKIIERYLKKDTRIKLIRHKENASAFQARLTGIKAASANFILFLDGDDELHRDAAKLAYAQAIKSGSDIVGFGSTVLRKDGSISRDYENAIQPLHKQLVGSNIVTKLFDPNKPSQGQMWRYLFSTKLLVKAYSYFAENQRVNRINDLPIAFLSASLAKKYTSINDKLYIYHFYAGRSGGANFDLEKFKFYSQGVDSINLLGVALQKAGTNPKIQESYDNTRLSVVYNVLQQIKNNLPAKYHREAISFLLTKIELDELVSSIATYLPDALDIVRDYLPLPTSNKKPGSIALFTNNLNTGGVQAVVASQAKYLREAGYKVSIVLLNGNDIAFKIPKSITVEIVDEGPLHVRLKSFKTILKNNKIDTVINHSVLYNFSWPFFNLIAKGAGIKANAWIHSFALRPMTEGNTHGKFLISNLSLIDDLIVLSKTDVSYWKSLGHKNVYYMPNPPSPLLLGNIPISNPKKAPKSQINIVWVGRLQQATKRVLSLVDIANELSKLTDNFTVTIIGPGSVDLTVKQLQEKVKTQGLENNIKVTGPKHGSDLIKELKKADIYINTSIIEGYLLTLVEAQSFGLPVVMYELPWLATVENNHGVIQTPQGNPSVIARELYELAINKPLYEKVSKASLDASKTYLSYDFPKLYKQLLDHSLPKEFSPEIQDEHMGIYVKWTQFYFADLMQGGNATSGIESIKQKDAEIEALKNSKSMKVGNALLNPLRKAKRLKHKLAKNLKNR